MAIDLTALDAAFARLQAAPGANPAVKAWAAQVQVVLHALNAPPPAPAPAPGPPAPPVPTPGGPPAPPATGGTGIGIFRYGGTLAGTSHLTDGTYDCVVADWEEAALLATVSGIGFAYTIAGAGASDNSTTDLTNPNAFVQRVLAYHSQFGFKGVFIDDVLSSNPLTLPFMKVVGPALRGAGLQVMANCNWFVSGDSGSDDGSIWRNWVTQLSGLIDYALLENWQWADNATPQVLRLRGTDAWFKHWDDFQKCPAAAHAAGIKFAGLNYLTVANAVYGRASMLLAPAAPGDVFMYGGVSYTDPADPYSPAWTTTTPHPQVDPVAGTASL